jgi:DNA-binding transcriptional MocR family regulator
MVYWMVDSANNLANIAKRIHPKGFQNRDRESPMTLRLERESDVPIYQQIFRQIRDRIVSGALPAGTRLVPERDLARELGVNRTTVVNAYRELKKAGYVAAHVGRGTTVLARRDDGTSPAGSAGLPWRHLLRSRGGGSVDPGLRDLLAATENTGVVSLAIGLPAPDLIPVETFRAVSDEVIRRSGAPALLHGPTEGITPLREAIARRLRERGIACDPAEVLVLSGSQQGLDIAARVLLQPGDEVVVEEPTYIGALHSFREAGVSLVSVPVDGEGLRVDVLETILERRRPRLVYTLPTYQNPAGVTMSRARRERLLDLAYRHQIPVLEDDPYSELQYDGAPPPALKALDERGIVLHMGTVSKILFPGLRLGWLVAPRPVVRRFSVSKGSMDLHSNTHGQWVLERFLREGHLDRHVQATRRIYARKRDLMLAALAAETGGSTSARRPEGGFYIWCRLPAGVDRNRLVAAAAEAGVSFLPGWLCCAEETEATHVRLNFSYPDEDRIAAGVARLAAAVRRSVERPPAGRRIERESRPIV